MEVKEITNLIMENILQYIHVLNNHTLNLHNVIPQFDLYKGWEKIEKKKEKNWKLI